ncbi:PX domain-containing protein EREX [Bienertia sinuspersici]
MDFHDGQHTVWPHDTHNGWRYCVTIPSWTTLSNSRGSGPVVYYRVQVGIQTPEAVTTTRGILRRFSDFLQLFNELQNLFPKKNLPAPPPRKLLGSKSRSMIEERRVSLEAWLEKLLSSIDVSRSAPVAIFLELEAAARSSFNDSSGNSFVEYLPSAKNSVIGEASSVASDFGDSISHGNSDIGTPEHAACAVSVVSRGNSVSDINFVDGTETIGASMIYDSENTGRKKNKSYEDAIGHTSYDEDGKEILSEGEYSKVVGDVMDLSTDSAGSEVSSLKANGNFNWGTSRAQNEGGLNLSVGAEGPIDEDMQSTSNLLVALPSDQRHKFSRVLVTMQRRLATAKADMEDLVARLDQELAVRQYLTTKLTDLEVDLKTTKETTKDNLQQAFSVEKEKYTQMQWDMEELRKKCLEMEVKLKAEQVGNRTNLCNLEIVFQFITDILVRMIFQDKNMHLVSENSAVIEENEMLRQELDVSRNQLENLQKHHEESETKSKTDLKVLVKEVKSLRSSQSDFKQELSKLTKEKLELEVIFF